MMPAVRSLWIPVKWIVSVLVITTHCTFAQPETNQPEAVQQAEVTEPTPQESETPQQPQESQTEQPAQVQADRRVRAIHVIGNQMVPTDALLNYVPYHVGDTITVQQMGHIAQSAKLIKNLYTELKRFRNISVFADLIEPDEIDIYIVVEEKTPLKDFEFKGNKNLSQKEIKEKINLDTPTIDEQELKAFAEQMKRLYLDKGFQNVAITTELELDDEGKATAVFTFDEGSKSRIRRIKFEGNRAFSDKELRNIMMFSKEEWVMSFLDKSGTYYPERIEGDKHFLEQFYQNSGYLHAKVLNIIAEEEEPGTNILTLTVVIEEGDRYTIKKVEAPGNDLISEEFLVANIPVKAGQYYSREAIANTIKQMETLWGNFGYIYASIEPAVTVDEDEKTVSISFISDIGKKITLNRINVKGNRKTRDKIIRRRIMLSEGDLLSQGAMDRSKNAVASMGYFDQQDGVNWKVRRLNDEEADLDLMVKEAKTGSASVQLSYGGNDTAFNSPLSAVNLKAAFADTNLFGSGTALNVEANWSKDVQTLVFHLEQPWLFDKPISGAMDIYHKRPSYDQLRHVMGAIHSRVTGGAFTLGFITSPYWKVFNSSRALFSLGLDSLKYNSAPQVLPFSRFDLPPGVSVFQANQEYAEILKQEFTPGGYFWVAANLEQDKRNHPMHPSRGQKWKLTTKVAAPSIDPQSSGVDCDPCERKIGFGKLFLDYLWFTPLINERDLIFKFHLFFGLASPYSNKTIPFGELFHIGGDTTVRGFTYGEIGPKYVGDTIGGKKAFYMNAELIFPITPDMNLKGVVFYDGGAGWDNPYVSNVTPGLVTDNDFDYRHSVGFGLRMLSPMPVRIDWGFKLDARTGEKESQVHFGMTYDW